jgi:hypothetical protein
MNKLLFAVAIVLSLLTPGAAQAQKALTNDDVVRLSKLGLGDEVVIAKIRQVEDVDFKLELDDLTKLKQAGLSSPVIAAMLDRANGNAGVGQPGSAGTDKPSDSHSVPKAKWMDIRLLDGDKPIRLVPTLGDITRTGFIIGFVFLDYPGLHARIRTSNIRPTLLIKSQYDPTNFYYLGKLDSNDGANTRSLKIDKKGGVFSATSRVVPASRWYADYQASEVSPGTWQVIPKRDLAAGEYGIVVEGGILYDFGVDR